MERFGKLEKLANLKYPDGQPIVVVQGVRRPDPANFAFRREISALLGRIRHGLTPASSAIIHVTSARSGEGVSTVARELAHAAAMMPWCRPLLLDRNAGSGDQGHWFGVELPDLFGDHGRSGCLTVVGIEAAGATFHAAKISADVILDGGASLAAGRRVNPGDVMQAAYNLVVVDCPPVLASSHFLLLVRNKAETLFVVRAGHTRLSAMIEAKNELASIGCPLSGVILNYGAAWCTDRARWRSYPDPLWDQAVRT